MENIYHEMYSNTSDNRMFEHFASRKRIITIWKLNIQGGYILTWIRFYRIQSYFVDVSFTRNVFVRSLCV